MSEAIKAQFQKAKEEGRPVLVTFVTAGHPSPDETVGVLKALQQSGVDIIELGVPFSDPIADGPVIQHSNTVALSHNVSFYDTLEYVRRARAEGVTVPILLMGYYNPILNIGEQKVVRLARKAGANGFIVVDLPPEEAVKFRQYSAQEGLSYIPLIAPSTPDDRIKFLASNIADSFIYVVSRMGITGASNNLSKSLPEFLAHIKTITSQVSNNGEDIPIAVGFGVSTHQHFVDVGDIADGVVIGSKLVSCLDAAQPGEAPLAAATFVKSILADDGTAKANPIAAAAANAITTAQVKTVEAVASQIGTKDTNPVHQFADRFGEFGGQYVPEVLVECLAELEAGFESAVNDPEFWKEYRSYYDYMGRPGHLHIVERLTEHAGGANIYLKREDLNHTGSHKINNALGQILIAKRLGKTRVIAETGAGQHGVATATVAAKFGMKCTVYMGAEDVRRQALNVFRIKLLGAEVVPVESGSRTLRDAVNEALRCWVTDLSTTHYIIGSAIGPHPYPTIVRTFQSVIGQETKEQMLEKTGRLPDAVIACVGGGSNAVGMFYPFEKDLSVKLIGVEAAGEGLDTKYHSATLTAGRPGVLHGVKTFLLQDENGQVTETHSVSAGLDYPGVGPELANWKFTGRAQFISADDAQALEGFRLLSQLEGIIPALESAHAVWGAIEVAKSLGKGKNIVICLSGRGDKDVVSVAENLPKLGPKIGWDLRFEETDPEKRKQEKSQ